MSSLRKKHNKKHWIKHYIRYTFLLNIHFIWNPTISAPEFPTPSPPCCLSLWARASINVPGLWLLGISVLYWIDSRAIPSPPGCSSDGQEGQKTRWKLTFPTLHLCEFITGKSQTYCQGISQGISDVLGISGNLRRTVILGQNTWRILTIMNSLWYSLNFLLLRLGTWESSSLAFWAARGAWTLLLWPPEQPVELEHRVPGPLEESLPPAALGTRGLWNTQ